MKDEGSDYVLDRIREGTLFGGGSVIEGAEGIAGLGKFPTADEISAAVRAISHS